MIHNRLTRYPYWIILSAVLITAIYLPSLDTPFDFIDDGNLVYPTPAMRVADRLNVVWDKIAANYEHLGPFRPTLWLHWEFFADRFEASPKAWRTMRLVWCMFAAGAMLLLMHSFQIRPVAALAATFLAIANPYRNEIWTSLTLAEGVAMPYALMALVAARRAGTSRRPWLWDLLGIVCILTALGCKNTFMVLIPAMTLLRIRPAESWREGIRLHWKPALALSLTMILPLAHYVYFKMHWHPGQYETVPPSASFFFKYLGALQGAISLDFLAAGFVLTALVLHRQPFQMASGLLAASLILLVGGTLLYLRIGALAGRYTMPAVWGLDLLIAAGFNNLLAAPPSLLKKAALTAIGAGLIAVGVASIGKQEKFAAKARLLWEIEASLEANAPPDAVVAWVSSPALNIEEGIHLEWHLHARGRQDIKVLLVNHHGERQSRVEIESREGSPALVVSAGLPPSRFENYTIIAPRRIDYWKGRRHFEATIYRRP